MNVFFWRSLPKSVKYYVAISSCWSCNFQFCVYFVCSQNRIRILFAIYVNLFNFYFTRIPFRNRKKIHIWDFNASSNQKRIRFDWWLRVRVISGKILNLQDHTLIKERITPHENRKFVLVWDTKNCFPFYLKAIYVFCGPNLNFKVWSEFRVTIHTCCNIAAIVEREKIFIE